MNPKFKKAIIWLGAVFLAWLIEKVLDSTRLYENIQAYFLAHDTERSPIGLLNRNIVVWQLLLWISAMGIGYWLFYSLLNRETRNRRRQKREVKKLKELQNILKKKNELVLDEGKLLLRFDVTFQGNRIDAVNIVPYCNLHSPPLKMAYNNLIYELQCSNAKCSYRFSHMPGFSHNPLEAYRNEIISKLEQEWKELRDSN